MATVRRTTLENGLRVIAALSFVAVACSSRLSAAPPLQPPEPVLVAKSTGDAAGQPPPNEVVRRIISGGEVFARLASSCEKLVVAAGKNPEQRTLEIDTSEAVGCSIKRTASILFDVTDPERIRSTCGTDDRATATPKKNEAVVAGVRLFSDSAACDAASAAVAPAQEPSCFEAALVKAVDQRKEEVPKGELVTRFETFIDDPSSTVWERSGDTHVCEPWRIQRTDKGFTFVRDWTEKKTTSVHSESGFTYDAACKRITGGGRSKTWTDLRGGSRGTSLGPRGTVTFDPNEARPDALPLHGADWFYTRRACERSPR